jgi:hypothetical protein
MGGCLGCKISLPLYQIYKKGFKLMLTEVAREDKVLGALVRLSKVQKYVILVYRFNFSLKFLLTFSFRERFPQIL